MTTEMIVILFELLRYPQRTLSLDADPSSLPGSSRHRLSDLHLHDSLLADSTAGAASLRDLFLLSHLLVVVVLGEPTTGERLASLFKELFTDLIGGDWSAREGLVGVGVFIRVVNIIRVIFITLA